MLLMQACGSGRLFDIDRDAVCPDPSEACLGTPPDAVTGVTFGPSCAIGSKRGLPAARPAEQQTSGMVRVSATISKKMAQANRAYWQAHYPDFAKTLHPRHLHRTAFDSKIENGIA